MGLVFSEKSKASFLTGKMFLVIQSITSGQRYIKWKPFVITPLKPIQINWRHNM